MSDKIEEIRKRHEAGPIGMLPMQALAKAEDDRATLLDLAEWQQANNERLLRLNKLLERNEREFLAAIGLATTTVLGPGHDPSPALSSMRLVLAEFEKQRAEIERLSSEIDGLEAELALMKSGFEIAYRAMGDKP